MLRRLLADAHRPDAESLAPGPAPLLPKLRPDAVFGRVGRRSEEHPDAALVSERRLLYLAEYCSRRCDSQLVAQLDQCIPILVVEEDAFAPALSGEPTLGVTGEDNLS